MMDLFAPRHLLIILTIALVVFGGKKLKTLGADLGSAVRGFKQAMKEGESDPPLAAASAAPVAPTPALPAQTAAPVAPEAAKTASQA